VLVECGFVRAVASDGVEWTFTPSLARIAGLGDPHEIVALYASLHGPDAAQTAAYVLARLCDQDDASTLIGWHEEVEGEGARLRWHAGQMPAAEQIIIARHLMQHGIVGKARPEQADSGKYSDRFDAAEYIAGARAHLGMSSADAEALSMTELQLMFEMKFPDQSKKKRDVPSREDYDAQMAAYKARSAKRV
jgi:hypothetical protein